VAVGPARILFATGQIRPSGFAGGSVDQATTPRIASQAGCLCYAPINNLCGAWLSSLFASAAVAPL
jgi:hypothetical protein